MHNRTIIYYTSNREDPSFEEKIRANILKEKGDILVISVSQKPINFDLVLENTGDLLFKSSGYIEIQNLITKQITKENLLPQNVLAHSSRQIFNTTQTDKYPYLTWYPETLFGIFKADG